MTIRKIEELEAWKEARKLAQMIFRALNLLPETEKYNLKKHLWECARNIPGGRYHYQESMQFFRVAVGSLNEIKSDTYLCLDTGYWKKPLVEKIINQIDKVIALSSGLISSTRKRKEEEKITNS
jgi:four helix bundle protein